MRAEIVQPRSSSESTFTRMTSLIRNPEREAKTDDVSRGVVTWYPICAINLSAQESDDSAAGPVSVFCVETHAVSARLDSTATNCFRTLGPVPKIGLYELDFFIACLAMCREIIHARM